MSALRLLRASPGTRVRRSVVTRSAPATFRQIPDSSATITVARRSYTSKGKEKESTDAAASNDEAPSSKPSAATDIDGAASKYRDTTKMASKAAADDTTTPASNDLAAQLQSKQDEIVDLAGRLRYAQADFINLQRISAREKEQTRDFAISRFAGELLETVDTLAMALRSVQQSQPVESASSIPPPYFQPSSQPPDALLKGVEATHRLLLQTLAKYGVKPFDPTGDKFDPNLHEALYSAQVPGKSPGEVIDCQKVGYMIKDRVLRAAQVGVAAEQQKQGNADEQQRQPKQGKTADPIAESVES